MPISSVDDLFSVRGMTALVTGASSGLGARFARVLAAHGAQVACCARRRERLDALAEIISEESGASVLTLPLDVTDGAAIAGAFDVVERDFGTVDILVNNAGGIAKSSVQEESSDGWRAMLDLNLQGAFEMTSQASRRLIATGKGGSIINVASTGALLAAPGAAAYAAAKAGLLGLTRAAAIDLAPHGIRCNALVPGNTVSEIFPRAFFATEAGRRIVTAIPLGRPAEPDDLDGALLLLASRASRYMTGTMIVVDGGKTVSQGVSATNPLAGRQPS